MPFLGIIASFQNNFRLRLLYSLMLLFIFKHANHIRCKVLLVIPTNTRSAKQLQNINSELIIYPIYESHLEQPGYCRKQ